MQSFEGNQAALSPETTRLVGQSTLEGTRPACSEWLLNASRPCTLSASSLCSWSEPHCCKRLQQQELSSGTPTEKAALVVREFLMCLVHMVLNLWSCPRTFKAVTRLRLSCSNLRPCTASKLFDSQRSGFSCFMVHLVHLGAAQQIQRSAGPCSSIAPPGRRSIAIN